MSAAPARHERIRASQRPEAAAHWGNVWTSSDRYQPFKVEGEPVRPRPRRWWHLFGSRL